MDVLAGPGLTRSRGLRRAVVLLAGVTVVLGAVQLAVVLEGPLRPRWAALGLTVTGLSYLVAGVVAWLRRPGSDVGALLVLGAAVWFVTGLHNGTSAALIALGAVTATVPLAVVVHLLVSFPTGRLTGRLEHAVVATAYVTSVVLQAPQYVLTDAPPPYDLLSVADRPDLVAVAERAQHVVGLAVMAVTAALLLRRLRAAVPSQRRVLAPLYAYSTTAVLCIPLTPNVLAPALGWGPVTTYLVQLALIGLIPVAFGWSILRGGFARTIELEELGAWLGGDERARSEVRAKLGDTLGDPTLDLVFWLPGRERYVDAAGREVPAPVPTAARAVSPVELTGTTLGAITYDPSAVDDPELVRTAGRVVALAVDRERLLAGLLAEQAALRRSRQRIVEAADRERRRVERNLHDGAQQHLLTVAIDLRLAQDRLAPDDPWAAELLGVTADRLEVAMRELRELARGLHPTLLTEVGLTGALESLAERSPVAVQLSVDLPPALPVPVEAGAYYVVAEALTNAARHARASVVRVGAQVERGRLCVEIVDDGVGGARVTSGSGLEGLGDRVDALGGRLRVWSPAGAGTTLVAELPCA